MGKTAKGIGGFAGAAFVPGSYVIDKNYSPSALAVDAIQGPDIPDPPDDPDPPPEPPPEAPMPDPEDEVSIQQRRRAAAARRRSGRSSTLLSENSSLGG